MNEATFFDRAAFVERGRRLEYLTVGWNTIEGGVAVAAGIIAGRIAHGKQRYAQLCQLGVGKDLAAQTASSPRGPWHLAESPALSYALPISYFDSLGLPRLFDELA